LGLKELGGLRANASGAPADESDLIVELGHKGLLFLSGYRARKMTLRPALAMAAATPFSKHRSLGPL
jgi:hypothetical protein